MEQSKKGVSLKVKSVIIILIMSVILCGVALNFFVGHPVVLRFEYNRI